MNPELGLFRSVPGDPPGLRVGEGGQNRCDTNFGYVQKRHGPEGGHVRAEAGGDVHIRDILDVAAYAMAKLQQYPWPLEIVERALQDFGRTWVLFLLGVEVFALVMQSRWKRPFAAPSPGCQRGPAWTKLLLAAAIIGSVEAAGPCPPYPARTRSTASYYNDLDQDAVRDGLRTSSEQLAEAEARWALSRPLMHNAGVYAPEEFFEDRPPPPVPPPPAGPREHLIGEDEERAVHISLWACSPHFTPKSIDVAVAFPCELQHLYDIVLDSVGEMSHNWLTHTMATNPQISEDYASVILAPPWLPMSGMYILLIDARSVGHHAGAVYWEGPVTRRRALHFLEETNTDDWEVYAFGALVPLGHAEAIQPVQAGVLQVRRRGEAAEWASDIDLRLDDPGRWNPQTSHPEPQRGRYIEFQAEEDRFLHAVDRHAARTPIQIVCAELNRTTNDTWLRAPTDRPRALCHFGQCVHTIVAVLSEARHPSTRFRAVIMDLRGVGLWPQWLAIEGDTMHPGDYIDGLQIPYREGYSVVVLGGQRTEDGVHLRVQDGELLEVVLRSTEDITPTENPEEDSESSELGEDDDTSDAVDMLPDSSDLSQRSPPRGPGPFGPPPPTPVHYDRSRSPRRHNLPENSGGEKIELHACLPPATHSIAEELIELPHTPEDITTAFHVWPSDWMSYDVRTLDLKDTTKQALQDLPHWSQLLQVHGSDTKLTAFLYVDGSHYEKTNRAGYGVAIILRCAGILALLGAFGGPILCEGGDVWDFEAPMALKAEQIAIATALLWLAQSRTFINIEEAYVKYDCQAAGKGAEGAWRAPNEFGNKLRHLEQYVRGMMEDRLAFEYTRAHVGEEWNELADCIAKAGAHAIPGLPRAPNENTAAFMRLDMSWMVATARSFRSPNMLVKAGQWLTVPDQDWAKHSPLQPCDLVPMHRTRGVTNGAAKTFGLRCATVNVQGLQHKHCYLDAQWENSALNIIFVQETKDSEGFTESKNYMRFASPSQRHWGTAIWVSKKGGIMVENDVPLRVASHDASIKYSDPRLLMLEINKGDQRIVVFSGHIPHAEKHEERQAYMKQLKQLLRNGSKPAIVLGGLDANGRPPPNFENTTGSVEFGEPDQAGIQFAELLQECGLWIPSTYEGIHQGGSATFQHASGNQHRLDFVVVGGSATITRATSRVATEVDLGATRDDHWLLEVDIGGTGGSSSASAGLQRPKYDRQKMMSADGQRILHQAWVNYNPPPWWEHVDVHCKHLQDYIVQCLNTNFPADTQGPRAAYIDAEIWKWRSAKLQFKQKVQHRKYMWGRALAASYFQWSRPGVCIVVPLLQKEGLLYQLAASAITMITHRIKQRIYQNKKTYLEQVIKEGPQTATRLLQRVRKFGVGGRQSKQSRGRKPLPKLLDSSGAAAATQADHDEIWLRHFGEMESGETLDITRFLEEKEDVSWRNVGVSWKLSDVPTLQEVEDVLRMAPRGKAMGLDAVPGEAVLASPVAAAVMIHPLMVKAATSLRQPLQWRGGILYEAHKGVGSTELPENHRALFISSILGKAYHRWIRNKTGEQLNNELHAMHLGSRKHAPLTYASLYILGHMRSCKALSRAAGVIFLDTKGAYYSIMREAVMGDIRQDETVARLMKRFNLDAEDMKDLWETIRGGGILREAGTSPAIQAMVCDIHYRTWFVTKYTGGTRLSSTYAGSRPGESFADAIFAFIYSRILGKVIEVATGEGLLSEVQADVDAGAFATPAHVRNGPSVVARDATWADDTAIPFDDDQPRRLLRKAQRLASLTISVCQSSGLQPNMKKGKTTAILALNGPGRDKARKEFFSHGRSTIKLDDVGMELPVAPQYVHLGGVVDIACSMKAEMRRRLAMASASFDAGRKLLFGNGSISLPVRAQLFRMTILATFYNLAIWTTQGAAWHQLSGGYTKILRRLLVPQVGGHEIYKVPAVFVHLATGCWTMELEATKSRMSLLTALATNGPEALWAMIQRDQGWLEGVRRDLQAYAKHYKDAPDTTAAAWPLWKAYLTANGRAFKYRVKKWLQKRHEAMCQEEVITVGLWGMYRQACQTLPQLHAQEQRWSCRSCKRQFKSKGGLGAHMFKTHGRTAAYRKCLQGTNCLACGNQYWTSARLATHLRDNAACVRILLSLGLTVKSIQPGKGSKLGRQRYVEEYNLAPTTNDGGPLEAGDGETWTETVDAAYRALCEDLQSRENWETEKQVALAVIECLCQHPLYYEEEIQVVEKADVELLWESDPNDPWTRPSYESLRAALNDPTRWLHPFAASNIEVDNNDRSYAAFKEGVGEEQWKGLLTALRTKCGTPTSEPYNLDTAWEALGAVYSGDQVANAALTDPLCFVPRSIVQLWQENEEQRDVFRDWFVAVKNTFIDVMDTGSEASRDWASRAKTEPPGGQLRLAHKAKVIRMKVQTWLQMLHREGTDREMIPAIVKELSDCLEKVANNDPDLHELQPLKQKAVEAVRSVLVGGNLNTYSDRYTVAWELCSLQGTAFPSTDLGGEAELSELQAEIWTDYLAWMDENHWLTESFSRPEKVVKDTIDMSAKAQVQGYRRVIATFLKFEYTIVTKAIDRQLERAKNITISVMKATVKLIYNDIDSEDDVMYMFQGNFAQSFSDEFVESTGAWILKKGSLSAVLYVRGDDPEMQTVQEQGPEEHNFDEIMRPLEARWKFGLKGDLRILLPPPATGEPPRSTLCKCFVGAKCLEETHAKAGQVVATFASRSVSHQRLNAEDIGHETFRLGHKNSETVNRAGDSDDFRLKEFVVQQQMIHQYNSGVDVVTLKNSEDLRDAGNAPRVVKGTLDIDEYKIVNSLYGTSAEAYDALLAFPFEFGGWAAGWEEVDRTSEWREVLNGLRDNWKDFINESVEEMDAYLTEFLWLAQIWTLGTPGTPGMPGRWGRQGRRARDARDAGDAGDGTLGTQGTPARDAGDAGEDGPFAVGPVRATFHELPCAGDLVSATAYDHSEQDCESVLQLENEKQTPLHKRMKSDPNIWFYRPMQEDLLAYATQDVMYLPLLHRRLCDQLGDTTGNNVLSRSRQYVNYSKMNLHLSSPKAAERRGLRLQAMLATHTEAALYFKLNLGAHRQGVVSREEALKNFKDMHYGDIAECWVSAWNTGGNILFLERLEAGHTFPADPDFTTGKVGRRKRRRPIGSHD
ncbi:unnamed protein product [Symbiodinium sp. CCMP2592]|nr:unnamed protein product [Symbiodinium sp. CCMP2592]